MDKVISDVSWAMQRSSSGRLLKTSKGRSKIIQQEERGLTLADTEGMFLLLGIGFLIGGGVLLSEWVGGCTNRCRAILKKRRDDKKFKKEEEEENLHPNSYQTALESSSNFSLDLENKSSNSLSTSDTNSTHLNDDKIKKSSHFRSFSITEANLNPQTIKELYEGPKRRHSSFVVIEGEMMIESEANRRIKERILKENKSVDFVNEFDENPNIQIHKAEINRPPTPYISDIEEEQFGEKISD